MPFYYHCYIAYNKKDNFIKKGDMENNYFLVYDTRFARNFVGLCNFCCRLRMCKSVYRNFSSQDCLSSF